MSEQLLPPASCHCQAQVTQWKEKYSKLEEKRGALRQAVKLLEQQINKIQAENLNLKKVYEQERAQVEKEGKERESAVKLLLESEISSLKSEILSLQQQVASSGQDRGDEKIKFFEAKLATSEKEINRLKELLKKEKTRADSEKKNTDLEKKRGNEAWKIVAAEKSKAESEKKILEQNIDEYKILVESLKKEADEARKKLGLETSKYIEANKKLELERKRLNKERQCADTEKSRAEEQRNLVEVNVKKLMEEKCHTATLSQKVEGSGKIIEKLRKDVSDLSTKRESVQSAHTVVGSIEQQLEAEKQKVLGEKKRADSEMRKAEKQKNRIKKYKTRAVKEKCRGDLLSAQLYVERQRYQELQQIQTGISSRKKIEAPSARPMTVTVDESAEVKLLKKQLKLQKMMTKHAKEVAEMERFRHSIIRQEVQRIKSDFGQISCRLLRLDGCFISSFSDEDDPKKNGNTEMQSWKMLCGFQSFPSEYMKPCREIVGDPTLGGSSTDFISGTASKSELPAGGSSRKKLKRSGINSALASFSDRGLVGSQDKGDITVGTPAGLLEDDLNLLTNASSPFDGKIAATENTAVVVDNNVRGPLAIDGDGVGKHGQKRKRLIDVVESVDNMCLKSRNLHLQIEDRLTTLYDMLKGQMERPVQDRNNLVDAAAQTQQRFEKTCLDYHVKNKEQSNNLASVVCGQISDEAHASAVEQGRDWQDSFLNGDYMKLLELDNPADEGLYQVAIQRPLSPTLPEINIEGILPFDLNMNKNMHQEVHCRVENLTPSVINIEVDSNNRIHCLELGPSKPSFTFSNNEEEKFSNQQAHQHGIIPGYFIYGCDMEDVESISRIYSTVKCCMGHSSFISDPEWSLGKILLELKIQEKLPPKMKVSAFFSMLLLKFSAIRSSGLSLNSDSISCIDSFTGHLCNVISDVETGSLLAEFCSVGKLLSLIEDFLLEGKLILCSEMGSEKLHSDIGISLVLEGVDVLISSEAASADLLIAGSAVLAAICTALDQIDLVYDASYRIFCSHGRDSSLVNTILHVFAHICGQKYFTWRSGSLLMTVLKSMVFHLEGSSCVLSSGEIAAESSKCSKCPFSEEAMSLDVIVSLLLDELQKFVISGEMIDLVDATQDQILPRRDNGERVKGHVDIRSLPGEQPSSSCLIYSGMTDSQSHNSSGANPIDSFLLVEVIAVNMGWEWTKTKILPQLLKLMESSIQERSAAAIIILVGQLGRLGVDSSGCNDSSVESLRCHLYSFLCQSRISKLGFPIQCAIVMAVLSLLPLDFESIIGDHLTLPDTASISVPAQAIRKWFFCLSKQEQSSMFTLLQPAAYL